MRETLSPLLQSNPNYRSKLGTRIYYERIPIKKEDVPAPPKGFTMQFGSDFKSGEPYAEIKGKFPSSQIPEARQRMLKWFFDNGWSHTHQLPR